MDFDKFSLMIKNVRVSQFAERLKEGKIMGTRCKKCQAEFYPPQADCSSCLSDDMDWFDLPTKGILASFTQVNVLPEYFALPSLSIPFGKASIKASPVGILEVKEGVRVMGWIPKRSENDLKVGETMRAEPFELDDGRLTIVLKKIE
ncbi:MAG: hypothetical protein JXA79_06865 [Deltaproteobacteria bacterium]|nr:hypothetical protein [Deltaproteobacteria bacterium]